MEKRRVFTLKSKTVLNRVAAPSMPFTWSINPYRGCSHGCAFCYARDTHTYIGMGTDDTFRTHLFVKADAPALLQRELAKGKWKGGWVAIGTATDPYQPLEKQRQITRGILEVLALYRIPVTITTRSPLILRDVTLLQELGRYAGCSVNISINTLDVQVWRSIEPESPHPESRFAAVRQLREVGIRTGIFLAPVLPFLTDDLSTLQTLLQRAREADASFVVASLLRLKPEVKQWFFQQLECQFPDKVPLYRSLYRGTYVDPQYAKRFREKIAPLLEQYGYAKAPVTREDGVSPTMQASMQATVRPSGRSPVGNQEQLSFAF
ncbi:SPL family radical SAM protein [Effusibacillus pohliae]|uniref:SPL family radical SAM protein n=1 Tax=Effusibacillus pohliae TaxID=232270 RepID=UPI00035ECDDF|nr:radical SAM protein [Effusibacillus pohliae]